MKIYWTIRSIPEFQGIDKDKVKQIWMPCYWKTYRHWQQRLMAALSIGSLLVFVLWPDKVYLFLTGGGDSINVGIFFLLFAAVLGLIWLVWSQISIKLARPYIVEILRNT